MCSEAHKETPYSELSFDPNKTAQTVYGCIKHSGVVFLSDHGLLIAKVIEPHFSNDKVASELLWWVSDKSMRGSREKAVLHEAYEYWAMHVVQTKAVQTGSFQKSKYFKRRGYQECETPYLYVRQ